MAKIVMEEVEEFPTLPDDSIIFVTVENVQTREVEGQRGNWTKLDFTFKVTGVQVSGDGSDVSKYDGLIGSKIWGNVPFRFTDSPDNRLKQWVEAILGMELTPGFELDTELLEGKKVRAITGSYEKKTVDSRTGRPFRQHTVQALLRMEDRQPVVATAAKVDPWANQDDEPGF
jgi:hypothetical protein